MKYKSLLHSTHGCLALAALLPLASACQQLDTQAKVGALNSGSQHSLTGAPASASQPVQPGQPGSVIHILPSPVPTAVTPLPSPIPAAPTASPEGTAVPSAAQIIDANGASWTISSDARVFLNGSPAAFTASVVLLVYHSGRVHQQNRGGGWWSWNGSSWDPAIDPRPIVSVTTTMLSQRSGMCVDVPGANRSPGVGLWQYSCNVSDAQIFVLTPTGDGFYTIATLNGNAGTCMDWASGAPAGGWPQVLQNPCTSGSTIQKWKVFNNADGTYSFQNFDGQHCLNIDGAATSDLASGAAVNSYLCVGSANENFILAGAAGRVF